MRRFYRFNASRVEFLSKKFTDFYSEVAVRVLASQRVRR